MFVATSYPILQALYDIIKTKLNWLYTDYEVWFHFGVLLNLAVIKLGQKLISFERIIVSRLYHAAVVKNIVKFS